MRMRAGEIEETITQLWLSVFVAAYTNGSEAIFPLEVFLEKLQKSFSRKTFQGKHSSGNVNLSRCATERHSAGPLLQETYDIINI